MSFSPLFIIFLLFSSLYGTQATSPASSKSSSSFIPSTTFLSTLRSTLDEIKNVMDIVSTFSGVLGGDLRLTSAVDDCLDLLDLSVDELTSSISASQSYPTSSSGSGNRRSDLRSWLSAALSNQDTCKESLDTSDGIVGSLVAVGLDTVTSLVSDGLKEIVSGAGADPPTGDRRRRRAMGFPKWVAARDRKLLVSPASEVLPDVVVAKDGTGNFTTLSSALSKAPSENVRRYVIYVKKGVYVENVEVKKKKWNLMLVGDGVGRTVISGSRNFVDGWTTYRSATLAVAGKSFIARDLTIENTSGPEKHQAVALRSDSDLSVFYRCAFSGYQDTLYAHSLRQFYRDCQIYGTVDFIFGNAAAVFQNCQLLSRLPLVNQKNSITAQGRKDPNQNTGFSFQFCNISADIDLENATRTNTSTTYTYLGRPWKLYSRTVFMQSYIGPVVRPEGWLEWDGDFALDTLFYGEYGNYGPGAEVGRRVKWPGFHAFNNSGLAVNFTVSQFIDGNLWLPSTGVKYTAGLQV